MENEKTYEQWEMEVKEGLADLSVQDLMRFTTTMAAYLVSEMMCVQANASEQEVPEVVDENRLIDLRRRIAELAVMLDVLQIRFGDAAEDEAEFLEKMEDILDEIRNG